jgi:FKBP-type peptidyl-prolyl cis-trans isomerase SlyD
MGNAVNEKTDEKKVVKADRVIILSYSILNDEGKIIEARPPDNPVQFLVGHGQILKALETRIIGETEGFKGGFTFTAEEAHGPYKKDLVVEMKRDQFPENVEVAKGMKFESRGPKGDAVALHVIAVKDNIVLVDGNHPLAGESLTFDVTILEVRDAAKEEIARGQVLTEMEPANKTLH